MVKNNSLIGTQRRPFAEYRRIPIAQTGSSGTLQQKPQIDFSQEP